MDSDPTLTVLHIWSIKRAMARFPLQLLGLFFLLLTLAPSADAIVEIGLPGTAPLIIEDVYLREGTAFVSIDDVLAALELEGEWDSVAHV